MQERAMEVMEGDDDAALKSHVPTINTAPTLRSASRGRTCSVFGRHRLIHLPDHANINNPVAGSRRPNCHCLHTTPFYTPTNRSYNRDKY